MHLAVLHFCVISFFSNTLPIIATFLCGVFLLWELRLQLERKLMLGQMQLVMMLIFFLCGWRCFASSTSTTTMIKECFNGFVFTVLLWAYPMHFWRKLLTWTIWFVACTHPCFIMHPPHLQGNGASGSDVLLLYSIILYFQHDG